MAGNELLSSAAAGSRCRAYVNRCVACVAGHVQVREAFAALQQAASCHT